MFNYSSRTATRSALLLGVSATAFAGAAYADNSKTFDMPALSAATGIQEFSREANVQIVASPDDVAKKRTNAIRGNLSVHDALDRLLAGTDMVVASNDGKTIVLTRGKADGSAPQPTILTVAQNTAPPAAVPMAQAPSVPNAAASQMMPEQVIVTGSLLGSANFAAPTPVTQVSEVQVQTRALTGIGTVIEELPYAEAGSGLTRNTSGIVAAAQSLPNLRGLGANDTLVLVDGQRPTPVNPTNNFDTDMIPSSLLDRFEVVTSGASASYGSDAVAGVVNFIMKDHLEGLTANSQYGSSQRGDEDQLLESVGYGTGFAGDKGHFIIGGEYAKQFNTVNMYARDWGQAEPGLVALPTTRAAGLPAQILTNHAEVDNGTEGGLITSGALAGTAFDASGSPYNFPYGSTVGGSYMIGTGNYGASSLNRQLSPPYQREALLARVEYDITPDVNAYAMVNYGQLESNDLSQGTPFPVVLTIQSGNPYIPASVKAAMTANGLTSITLAKENIDGFDTGNIADNKNTLLQSFFGLKGGIFNDWDWDVQGSAGRSEVWQSFLNAPVTANLAAASNVIAGPNGTPICAPVPATSKASPGCVPYNPFGTNATTASSVDYIMNYPGGGPDGSKANIRQYMVNADIRGPAFSLPAGPISTAFGANWRYNSYSQLGSPAAVEGLFVTRNPPTFDINQSTWETYGEVGIPVLKDLPFAKAVDLNAAARHTDYSITGGVNTWKLGGTWDINDAIRLRVTRSQDIRAPNFTEIANVPTSSATNVQNPISGISQRVANILTTGNPDLMPEIAQNFTAGIVLQPTFSWLTGFRASVDYYRIKISGQITSVTPQDTINRCLLQNLQDYCSQIQFTGTDTHSTFGIAGLTLHDVNLNSELQDGYDINVSERLPLDQVNLPGAFTISALGTYTNQQRVIQSLSNGTVSDINYADTLSAPRWAWNVNFTYSLDRLTTNLQMRYYSPIRYSATNIGPDAPTYDPSNPLSINQNLFPAAVTWNLAIAYDLIQKDNGEDLQAYLNIDNLLDKNPPIIWSYVSNYDVVGRFFKVGLRYVMP